MTSDTMYTARCDEVAAQAFREFLRKLEVKALLIVKEDPGNNPHYHYYFESDKSESAIKKARTRFEAMKPFKGNKYISISVLRESKEEYLRYLCKGYNVSKPYSLHCKTKEAPKIVHRTICDLLDEDIVKYHNEFWEVNKELVKDKPKVKRKVTTWTQQLVEDICIASINQEWDYEDDKLNWIAEYIIEYTIGKSKPFDKFILKKMMNICVLKIEKLRGGDKYFKKYRDELVRDLKMEHSEFFSI